MKTIKKIPIVLIPAYEPDENFLIFIKDLKNFFENIVVVNDGSDENYENIFEEARELGVILIKNYINLGKGRALKYGINHILNVFGEDVIIVTADCDGQHSVLDINKCYDSCLENQNHLILGVRNFNYKNVPFKSSFGNKTTSKIFKMFLGVKISDTQTGLRAFSGETSKIFLGVLGERFEYETKMLIDIVQKEINITEVPIKTIYINENSGTHFKPIQDSFMIYSNFIKYIFSSFSSFLIDILLFMLCITLFISAHSILISTVISRILSSLYNFLINSKFVFKNKSVTQKSFFKYYTLAIIQLLCSAFFVEYIYNSISVNLAFIKILVDISLFLISFNIQKNWVFKNNSSPTSSNEKF